MELAPLGDKGPETPLSEKPGAQCLLTDGEGVSSDWHTVPAFCCSGYVSLLSKLCENPIDSSFKCRKMLPTTHKGSWLIIQTIKFGSQPESSLHCCIVVVSPLFLTTITCLNPNNPIVATIAFLIVHNEDPTTGTWSSVCVSCSAIAMTISYCDFLFSRL